MTELFRRLVRDKPLSIIVGVVVAPRLALWPGLCLTVVVYCLNMFGDAVRDLLDPRLRGGGGRLGADRAASV